MVPTGSGSATLLMSCPCPWQRVKVGGGGLNFSLSIYVQYILYIPVRSAFYLCFRYLFTLRVQLCNWSESSRSWRAILAPHDGSNTSSRLLALPNIWNTFSFHRLDTLTLCIAISGSMLRIRIRNMLPESNEKHSPRKQIGIWHITVEYLDLPYLWTFLFYQILVLQFTAFSIFVH